MSTNPSASPATSQSTLSVPPGTQLLHEQVAGHKFGQCKFKFGLLRHTASGDILKPVCDRRSERELQFYKEVFQDNVNDIDRCLSQLRTFLPCFNGVHHDNQYNMDYLRLGDVLATMVHPSVMDIKIGPKTYDPEASNEKIATEMSKYKHAAVMGFRILGMRVSDNVGHATSSSLTLLLTNLVDLPIRNGRLYCKGQKFWLNGHRTRCCIK